MSELKKLLELDVVITIVLLLALTFSVYAGANNMIILERNETSLKNVGNTVVYLERKGPSLSGMAILGAQESIPIGEEENVTAQQFE